MAEGHESQELAIPDKPDKIVKSERKGGIAQTVRNVFRKPAAQAITQTPIEQAPDEMSVERARKILERIVDLHEDDLDFHERNLTPAEQFKRFGGGPYKDEVKKAFSVYADHLVTTHGAKKPSESYSYKLFKKDLPGPPHYKGNPEGKFYYNLGLSVLLDWDWDRSKTPKAIRLTLSDTGKLQGWIGRIAVESHVPLVDFKPGSTDEQYATVFRDTLSGPNPDDRTSILSGERYASMSGFRAMSDLFELGSLNTNDLEVFHRYYKYLHLGMRWTAANLLCWDENRIVYPDDLDKPQSPLDKGQAQLSKPKLELPPKK